MTPPNKIIIFETASIRRTLHNGEWYFSVEDVITALTDSADAKQYIQKLKQRDPILKAGWVQIVLTLALNTVGGTQRMNCANTEGIFRIIQSEFSP
jgi:prophage antirepressor-like protein